MTLRVLILSTVTSALLTCGVAQAQSWQATPQAPITNFNVQGEPQTLATGRISRHLGVQTEVFAKDSRDLSQAAQRDRELDQQQSAAFGVAYVPLAKNADLYARIGKGGSRDTLSGARDDGWAYGAGAQIIGKGAKGFRADYTRQGLPRSDVKADIVSFGFVSRF
jgi:hypothetical protein